MSLKLSFCLKAATTLRDDDLGAITDGIEAYVRAGMSTELAEEAAVTDLLAAVNSDRADMVKTLREQHPNAFQRTPQTPAQRSAAAKARRAFNVETDSVLQAVAKMGGIRRDIVARDFGLKPEELKHTVEVGGLKGYPFRASGGLDLDRVLTNLQEVGYFAGVSEEDIRSKFEEAVYSELRGDKVLTVEGQMRQAEEAAHDRLDQEEQAEREALMAESDLTEDDIGGFTDDDIDWFGTKAPADQVMRALGFSEQEIQDELAREAAQTGAGQDGNAAGEATAQAGATGSAEAGTAPAGTESRPDLTLAAPTRAEVLDQQSALEKEQADKEAPADQPKSKLTGEQPDMFNTQGGLFGGTVNEPDAPYTTDLFGNALPDQPGKTAAKKPASTELRGDALAAAGLPADTPAPAGDYLTRTIVGSEVQRKLGAKRITTPAEAAAATRYLYASAVERLDGIVTDADGKPLAVVGGFKGALSQASIYPATLVGEAIRIKGAANIWFSHNHPSGLESLSRADEHLNQMMSSVFAGSGIEPRGLMAVAGNRFAHVSSTGRDFSSGEIPLSDGSTTVPTVERQLSQADRGPLLDSPAAAKAAAKVVFDASGKKPLIMLADGQNRIVAWVPITPEMQGKLRGTGGLAAVYRAVSESNAGAAFIVHGGELDAHLKGSGHSISQNIASALRGIDVRTLDSINVATGESAAMSSESLTGGVAFSLSNQDLAGGALPVPEVIDAGPIPAQDAAAVALLEKQFRAKVEAFKALTLQALPRVRKPGPDASLIAQMRYAAADLAEKMFGKRVVFFSSNIPFANGMQADYVPGSVFINEGTSRPIMAVLGHELLHSLRQDHPALYAKLADRLGAMLEEPGRYHEQLNQRRKSKGLAPLPFDKLREELIADIVGDNFTDPVFWRKVAQGQPTLFGRVLRVIRDFLDNLLSKLRNERPYGTDKYLNDIQGARDAVVEAMREFANHPKTAAAAVANAAESNLSLNDGEHADLSRIGTRMAYQGYEKANVPRVQAARELQKLLDQRAAGIAEVVFQSRLEALAARMAAASETKQANRLMGKRERGADIVREKLLSAKRRGDISEEAAEFAMWMLDKNPALAEGLGISVRSAGENAEGAGNYNPLASIMTLFKAKANDGTPVHEVLHHTERMMPEDVQAGIQAEWMHALDKTINAAVKAKNTKLAEALVKLQEAAAGDRPAQREVAGLFGATGPLDYDAHYQLVNPSEYWAVNGTRIMAARYDAKTWQAKAQQWMRELFEKVKGLLGMKSDAPILRALKSIMEGDGSRQSDQMLSEAAAFSDPSRKNSNADDEKAAGGLPMFSLAPNVLPPAEGWARAFQRKLQDNFNRFTTVRKWATEHGANMTPESNVWAYEERMHGRIASRVEDFREKRVKPAVAAIQKAGFTMEQVAEFLHAQHAAERNKQVGSIPGNTQSGSGMTDAEAAAILAAADPKLAALANDFRKITDETQDILLKAGIISQDTVDAWSAAYKNYVPLKGGDDAPAAKTGTGKGLNVSGKQKRALGHDARQESIIENIMRDHERAITLAEKNRVGHSLLAFIADLANDDIATIGEPEKRKVLRNSTSYEVRDQGGMRVGIFDSLEGANKFISKHAGGLFTGTLTAHAVKGDPTVSFMASPMLQDNEVNVYVDGYTVRVQLKDDLLARAYTRSGTEGLNKLLAMNREINNFLSKAYTGYNPEFLATNVIRDFTTGLINVTGKFGATVTARAVRNYPTAFATLIRYSVTGKETPAIKAYRDAGGSTGSAYLGDLERIGKDVQASYDEYRGVIATLKGRGAVAAGRTAARKMAGTLLALLEHLNAAGESAMRLSVFESVRTTPGYTVDDAASAAKNSTVNFNRKGELGPTLGALYLFFNPSIQGTAAILDTLVNGQHKAQAWALAGSLGALSYALAAGQFGGGEDDDEFWLSIPDSTKDKNIIIRTGKSTYKTIPVPYGYGFIYSLGNSIYALQKGRDAAKVSLNMASNLFEHFSPIGNPIGDKLDVRGLGELVPGAIGGELMRDAVRVATNRSGLGSDIVPDSPFDKEKPDNLKLFRSTKGSIYEKVATAANAATGGTKSLAGGVDVSPETLKFWARAITGGSGAFLADFASMTKNTGLYLANPTDPDREALWPDAREIPIVRRFAKEETVQDRRRMFWEAVNEVEGAKADLVRARKSHDEEAMQSLSETRGELLAMGKFTKGYIKAVKAARDEVDAIMADETTSLAFKRARSKEIEDGERQIYNDYVRAFTQARTEARKQREAATQ